MPVLHPEPHPLAGHQVTVTSGVPLFGQAGCVVRARVDDWWDRVAGESWKTMIGNPVCVAYDVRTGLTGPSHLDDEVVYVKTADGNGHLVHATEIAPADPS